MTEPAVVIPDKSIPYAQNSRREGNKLLADAQRAAKGPSGQRICRLLPEGRDDNWDAMIQRLEAQVAEMQQVLVINNTVNLYMIGLLISTIRVNDSELKYWCITELDYFKKVYHIKLLLYD